MPRDTEEREAPDPADWRSDWSGPAIIEAESVVVRCPKCGRHLPDPRGMLVWTASVLDMEIVRAPIRECAGRDGCGTLVALPASMPTVVEVQKP